MQIGLRGGFLARSIHTDVIDTFRLAHAKEKDAIISKTMSVWDVICDRFNDGNQRKALGLLFDIVQLENANLSPDTSIHQKIANTAKAQDNFWAIKALLKKGYTLDMASTHEHQTRVFVNCPKSRLVALGEVELPIHFNKLPGEFQSTLIYTSQGHADLTDNFCTVFNALCNATSMGEKLRCFGELQQLDCDQSRSRYACRYELTTNKLSLLIDGLEIECMEPTCNQADISSLCPENLQFTDIEYDLTESYQDDEVTEIDDHAMASDEETEAEEDAGEIGEPFSDDVAESSDDEDEISLACAEQLELDRLRKLLANGIDGSR